MASKKKVERIPVPYHEWVRMEARLFALNMRGKFQGDELKRAGKLTRDDRSELALLRKRCKSSDDTDYALHHHCEAITAGVIVPSKDQGVLCQALKDAYRLSRDDQVTNALVNALAAFGVTKKDLPQHIDDEEEKDEKEE